MTTTRKTVILSPEVGGHCSFYLALIAEAFGPDRPILYADCDAPATREQFRLRGLALNSFQWIRPNGATAAENLKNCVELSSQHEDANLFIAYLDHYLEPLIKIGQKSLPLISGIWFHPYALDHRYNWLPPFDKRLRYRGMVHRALRQGRLPLRQIYFLDSPSVTVCQQLSPSKQINHLVDPGEYEPILSNAEARKHFSIPDTKTVFLHAGSSEKRKGLDITLDAFTQVCRDPELAKQILLLRVGENSRLNRKQNDQLTQLTESGSALRIDGYVSSEDFIHAFSASDWVLLPYKNFRFSSGILANAMLCRKPVITSCEGLVGRTVLEEKSGLRHLPNPKAFADTIARALKQPTLEVTAASTKSRHSKQFVQTLKTTLLV